MATSNQVNIGLSGSTGTGNFVGSTSPTIVTPKIAQINDTNGNALLTLTTSASAVNYLDIKNGGTTAGPILTSVGSDTNIGMTLSVKNAGSYAFQSTSSANFVIISPNITGNAPTIYGAGSDTNVNLQLQAQGTGQLVLVSANTTSPVLIYNGTGNQHTTTFSMANTAASRTVTFPDATGTLLMTGQAISTVPSINFGGSTLDTYQTGTWTPTDASGASLSLTATGGYTRIGNMVFAYATITYPVTANGNNNTIGGLPYTSANSTYAIQGVLSNTTGATARSIVMQQNNTTCVFQTVTAGTVTNAQMSATTNHVLLIYPIA